MKFKFYSNFTEQADEIQRELEERGVDFIVLMSRDIAIEGDYGTIKGYDNIRRYLLGPKKVITV